MTDFTTRAASAADIPAIGNIAEATDLFPSDMLGDMIAGYLSKAAEDIWFVAKNSSGVIAFGFCEPERMTEGTWNLLAIGVEPSHQGSGIGGQMMRYVEDQLSQQSARILLVETMGTPELSQTRDFYLKNGYSQEACIREYYEPGADKIVFWKRL